MFTVGRTLAALCLDIPGFDQEHRYVLPGRSDMPLLARWPSFDQLLRRATALEPEERFGSVEDLAGQLIGVLHEIVAAERGRPAPRVSAMFTGELHGAESGAPAWQTLPSAIVDTHDPAAGLLATMGQRAPW